MDEEESLRKCIRLLVETDLLCHDEFRRARPAKSLGRFRPFFITGFRHAVVTVLSSFLFSDADLVGSTFSRHRRVDKWEAR